MTEDDTPLDAAFAAMAAAPEDVAARLRFHERLLDAELFVPLEADAQPDRLDPQIIDVEDGRFVLAFDRDARLAAVLDAPAPYAALSGRSLAALLAGRGVGIALNPGVAPSETALDPETVDWLAGMAARGEVATLRLRAIGAPRGADRALIAALDAKLATMVDRIDGAWLARIGFEDGSDRMGLGLAGVPEAAQPAIAAAIAEAVRFCGLAERRLADGLPDGRLPDGPRVGGLARGLTKGDLQEGRLAVGGLDVTFLDHESPALAAFERVGLRLELPPRPPSERPAQRPAPGADPDRPPILR